MFQFFKSPFFSVNPKRDLSVETIRGLACIFLVSFHAVGGNPDQGMAVGANDWLYLLQQAFGDMRMPLFSFISGFVFLSFPMNGGSFKTLTGKKARRLLLPLASVGSFCWLVRTVMGMEHVPYYMVYFYAYNIYWYLQSTFLMMALFLLVNYFSMKHAQPKEYQSIANMNALGLGILGAVVLTFMFPGVTAILSIQKVFYLLPFFMAGYLLGQVLHTVRQRTRPIHKVIAFVLLVNLVIWGWVLSVGGYSYESVARRAICIPIGILTALSLFVLAPKVRLLAWVGDKSYAIYLFHIFFTAATEMVWRKVLPTLDIHYGYPVFLAAGIMGPIILSWFILQIPLSRWLVLGLPAPKMIQRRFQTAKASS
nr:acyltransferase [uncultured Cohaesibacter sp.]